MRETAFRFLIFIWTHMSHNILCVRKYHEHLELPVYSLHSPCSQRRLSSSCRTHWWSSPCCRGHRVLQGGGQGLLMTLMSVSVFWADRPLPLCQFLPDDKEWKEFTCLIYTHWSLFSPVDLHKQAIMWQLMFQVTFRSNIRIGEKNVISIAFPTGYCYCKHSSHFKMSISAW